MNDGFSTCLLNQTHASKSNYSTVIIVWSHIHLRLLFLCQYQTLRQQDAPLFYNGLFQLPHVWESSNETQKEQKSTDLHAGCNNIVVSNISYSYGYIQHFSLHSSKSATHPPQVYVAPTRWLGTTRSFRAERLTGNHSFINTGMVLLLIYMQISSIFQD